MTSKAPPYGEAYVWVWLPDKTEPVVAGRSYQKTPQCSAYNRVVV